MSLGVGTAGGGMHKADVDIDLETEYSAESAVVYVANNFCFPLLGDIPTTLDGSCWTARGFLGENVSRCRRAIPLNKPNTHA